MKKLFFLLLVTFSQLISQEFSRSMASANVFLGFDATSDKPSLTYIDESSSLVWQNNKYLKHFYTRSAAQNYCKNLHIDKLKWSLPLAFELKSLNIDSRLAFTEDVFYLVHDNPVWDNRSTFAYDSKRRKSVMIKDKRKLLYVRCVARLED